MRPLPIAGVTLACVLLAAAFPAHAQLHTCSASAISTAFGAYDPFSPSPLEGTGEVRVSCSLLNLLSVAVSYEISLSRGSSGTFATRRMDGAGGQLAYNLYADAARTQIWGDGTGGTSTRSDGYLLGLLATTRAYSIYGRVAPAQNLPAGSYADTIVVTVSY